MKKLIFAAAIIFLALLISANAQLLPENLDNEAAIKPDTDDETNGEFCGGIAGIKCPAGYECELSGDYPDAGGHCIKTGAASGFPMLLLLVVSIAIAGLGYFAIRRL